MSFVKKIWKDRISQFPNRRTINDGHTVKRVTVGRDEGVVTEEGTPFDATEMNDLENRIFAAIEQGGGGGGSTGTYNYTELFNKPRINNHELDGNKSLGDLGIASNANELPIELGSATNTKAYIDSGLSGKANKSWTYNGSKEMTGGLPNGSTWNLNESIANANELLFQICVGNNLIPRYTINIPYSQFVSVGAYPDWSIASDRLFVMLGKNSNTQLGIEAQIIGTITSKLTIICYYR